MLFDGYRELFVVIATSAATLIGLLFVAISVSPRWAGDGATEHQVKAGAAFAALIGPLVVSLAALIPGTGLATACIIVSGSGIVSAIGLGAFLVRRHTEPIRARQVVLLLALAALEGGTRGFACATGMGTIRSIRPSGA